nr:MAG TPA: hypothetical protein [Bacteriophage sp.]DAN86326.1 MAG TPA: hypothetical protein [Bacteriophage sp.]
MGRLSAFENVSAQLVFAIGPRRETTRLSSLPMRRQSHRGCLMTDCR